MSENQTDTDREKLRAFEKKMHDEGAAGFADGPSPWETWDDKTGILGKKRVWEGTSKRIYTKKHTQPSLGDRVLSGLAMLSLATMVVGIAGVYFSDHQPPQVAVTGVQPLPIERTPAATDGVIANLQQLPAPAAGEAASDSGQDAAARPAPAAPTEPDAGSATDSAPSGDNSLQAAAPPVIATELSASQDTASTLPDAGGPGTADSETAAIPAPETSPAGLPVAAPVSIAADTPSPAEMTAAQTAMPAGQPSPAVEPAPGTTDGITVPQPDSVAGTAAASTVAAAVEEAEPAVMSEPPAATGIVDDTAVAVDTPDMPAADAMAAAETEATPAVPVDTAAAAVTSAMQPGAETATTAAGLEAQPATVTETTTMADAIAEAAGSTGPEPATQDTAIAVTGQDDRTDLAPPAAAAADSVPAGGNGDWVVNLAAYTRESTARRMLAEFRDQGVDAELVSVVINDRPMYRIRVAGFASSNAARARISPLEQQLDLDGVWIGRK